MKDAAVRNALQFALYISKMCLSTAQQTVEAWKSVFYISAAVYAFSTVFYGLFGSGDIQPWAAPMLNLLGVQLMGQNKGTSINEPTTENSRSRKRNNLRQFKASYWSVTSRGVYPYLPMATNASWSILGGIN